MTSCTQATCTTRWLVAAAGAICMAALISCEALGGGPAEGRKPVPSATETDKSKGVKSYTRDTKPGDLEKGAEQDKELDGEAKKRAERQKIVQRIVKRQQGGGDEGADVDIPGLPVDQVALDGGAEGSEYKFYWSVTRPDHAGWFRQDTEIDIDGLGFERDVVMFYQFQLGNFPLEGPHVLVEDPSYLDEHVSKISEDLDRMMAVDFDGLAIIDYETWYLNASRTKDHFLVSFHSALLQHRPEVFDGDEPEEEVVLREYEAAAKAFYLATLRKCQELRPDALWGFYGYPPKRYRSGELPSTAIGYDDHTHLASQLNDELAWLFEEVDALYPSIYTLRQSVGPDEPRSVSYQNLESTDVTYVTSNVREAVRLANGKPVYPVVWYKYQTNHPMLAAPNDLLNEFNLTSQLLLPAQEFADGVVLWGHIQSAEESSRIQTYIDSVMTEVLEPDDDQ